MKNIVTRSLSGIVYVALIVAALVCGQAYSMSLFSIIGVLALIEFQNITMGASNSRLDEFIRAIDIAVALVLINFVTVLDFPQVLMIAFISITFGYGLFRFTLALYNKSTRALSDVAWSALSLIYIAIPLMMLSILCSEQGGWKIVLTMFVMIWLNDTGAYCVGSLCGKHPLFPRLSPKKSWEGFAGGLIFSLLSGVGAYYFVGEPLTMPEWLGLGLLVCVLSTWGDLFESLIKRSHNIKDSGHLIPGHGGILDRIDSMLFASVGVFIVMFFVDMI